MAKKSYIYDYEKQIKVQVHCAFDALVKIEDVRPNPENPNVHPVSQIDKLALNIAAHGWRQVISVSKRSGLVVSGHARLLAANKLHLMQVPVNYQEFKSKSQELAVLISDNFIAELATVNAPGVADILLELDKYNYDLKLTGLDDDKIKRYIEGPPSEPENIKLPTEERCPNCGYLIK